MSYQRTGDVWSDTASVITGVQNVKDAIGPALEIVNDPYFPQVVGMIRELHELEQPDSGPSVPGVGLRHLAVPLKMYVEARKHPYTVAPLMVGVLIGAPFLIGYLFGKKR